MQLTRRAHRSVLTHRLKICYNTILWNHERKERFPSTAIRRRFQKVLHATNFRIHDEYEKPQTAVYDSLQLLRIVVVIFVNALSRNYHIICIYRYRNTTIQIHIWPFRRRFVYGLQTRLYYIILYRTEICKRSVQCAYAYEQIIATVDPAQTRNTEHETVHRTAEINRIGIEMYVLKWYRQTKWL